MKSLMLTAALECDGGDRVLREIGIIPGPNLHYGEVIKEGEQVKSWIDIPGEEDVFLVTQSVAEIQQRLNDLD